MRSKPPNAAPVDDAHAYQSMFGTCDGAVAAPTASLHFTPRVMEAIAAAGVEVCDVVLHVGPGTFLPIRPDHAEDVRKHRMHREAYDIPQSTLDTGGACPRSGQARSGGGHDCPAGPGDLGPDPRALR